MSSSPESPIVAPQVPSVDPTPVQAASDRPRWQGVASRVCTVLFAILAVLSVVTTWLSVELLNTDRYVDTVSNLAADPAIQDAVAQRLSTLLVDQIGPSVTPESPETTDEGLFSIASLTRAASIQLIDRTVAEVVQSDAFQGAWTAANRLVHPQVVALLRGEDVSLASTAGGQVMIDLTPLVVEVQTRLSDRGFTFLDRITIEPAAYSFVVFESSELASAQSAVDLLLTLRWLLPVLAIVALAAAMVLASNRWREATAASLGVSLAMVLVLVVLSIARNRLTGNLAPGSVAAATAFFDILVESLRELGRFLTLLGLAVAGGAFVLMPANPWRSSISTFVVRYRDLLYGAVIGVGCLVIVFQDQPSIAVVLTVAVLALVAGVLVWWIDRSTPPLEPAA